MQFSHGEEKRHPEIGIGSYVYMRDEDGEWKWWMLVHLDERPMFRQYQVLETNHILKWISDGKIYSTLAVQRIQQSYNSGLRKSHWVALNQRNCGDSLRALLTKLLW